MSTKKSKCLVIDVSIAHSSGGEEATYPTSVNCRDFLKAVLSINPDKSEEKAIEWLENGAPPNKYRLLGNSGDRSEIE